ncbi:MAG: hypothetical protein AAFU67_08595, partial [Bacteroidota bacterium]
SYKYDVHSLAPLITELEVVPANAANNQYTFNWEACAEFPNYEFQLLRLFNNDSSNLNNPNEIAAMVDWDQALWIETQNSATSLTISIVEGSGYYVWRVRPIGDYHPGNIANDLNWGAWSGVPGFEQGATPTLAFNPGQAPGPHVFFYQQFDEDLNFNYERFFTEGGRVKEGITYANSLLQVEQTQVHIETDDGILVSQTAMDFVGRPAWSSLPTPVEEKVSLGYEALFVKDVSGGRYDADNFDTNDNYRNPEQVLDNNGEAFSYYSDNNPDQRIPTAEGYPYSRTRFYNNGVNQVAEVGGPGATHRLKTGDEARTQRTLYGGVADAELIRIFGDEAPSGESVHKIINIDANNVASVDYRSKAGQTLATCLSVNGVNPLMDGLPSKAEAGFSVVDTLTGDLAYGDYGSQTTTTIAVTEPTTIELHYEITAATVEDLCQNYCATCDYSIQFLVQDATGEQQTDPLDFTYLLPPGFCEAGVFWDTVFVVNLPELGMYTVSRKIRAANQVPGSSPAISYLEEHLNTLSEAYDQQIEQSLAWAYDLLDAGDLETLYATLGVNTQVANPDSVFSDSLVYLELGCTEIPLPILYCPQNECPPSANAFTDYFADFWEAQNPDYLDTDNGRLAYLDYRYRAEDFTDLIENMLADGYVCNDLWNCWIAQVQNYGEMLALSDATPGYEYSLVESFLDCTGRRMIGSYPSTEWENYLDVAYKYFPYDGQYDECEAYACGTPNCEPTTPAAWDTLYLCVTHVNDEPSPPVEELTEDNEDNCADICESRRNSFATSLVQMFHNDSLYVEGDEFVLVRDEIWGQTFIPWTDSLLNEDHVYDVSQFEINCMVNSLVARCKEGCELTTFINPNTGQVDSVGSSAEIQAMIESMTYAFEVELPDEGGNCSTDFETITDE